LSNTVCFKKKKMNKKGMASWLITKRDDVSLRMPPPPEA